MKRPCLTKDCPNFCILPNSFCGRCGGYEHEMSEDEKDFLLRENPIRLADEMRNSFNQRRMK